MEIHNLLIFENEPLKYPLSLPGDQSECSYHGLYESVFAENVTYSPTSFPYNGYLIVFGL